MKFLKQTDSGSSDKELVDKIVRGDQNALSIVIDRHMTSVFRLSYSLLKDVEKAEDMTQETFITLWQQADQWSPSGKLISWLMRIARNKSIDEIRKNKLHSDIDDVAVFSDTKSPHEHMFDRELAEVVHIHMNTLAERQREAINLVHFIGCSNIEAAEILGVSVEALESLLARGRRKLKSLMSEQKDILLKGDI